MLFRSALKMADKTVKDSAKIINQITNFQKSKCVDRKVCGYNCNHLIKCPVPIESTQEYLDFTKRVQKNIDEKKSYNWVCKNALFSGNNQKTSKVSILFRKLIEGTTGKTEKDFSNENEDANETKYDELYLEWATKPPQNLLQKQQSEVLLILDEYKNGLKGFTKICKENPEYTQTVDKKLTEYEEEAQKAINEQKGNSMANAFHQLKIISNQLPKVASAYKQRLFDGLKNLIREKFIEIIKGSTQREYCMCSDYGRYFYHLHKLSIQQRQSNFGIQNLNFSIFYLQSLKNTCSQKCSDSMNKKGFSKREIEKMIKEIKLTIQNNSGDKNNGKMIDFEIKNGVITTIEKDVERNVKKTFKKRGLFRRNRSRNVSLGSIKNDVSKVEKEIKKEEKKKNSTNKKLDEIDNKIEDVSSKLKKFE